MKKIGTKGTPSYRYTKGILAEGPSVSEATKILLSSNFVITLLPFSRVWGVSTR